MWQCITANLMGGLGNQLFQIAAAYAYSRLYFTRLVFPEVWNASPGRPPVWTTYFPQRPFPLLPRGEFDAISWEDIRERTFSYTPLFYSTRHANYRLNGYFQSSLYFREYKDEVRVLLQVPPHLLKEAPTIDDTWILAHVRRTDYLNFKGYHDVTNATYFKRARLEIERRLGSARIVCWVTDDPAWVRSNVLIEGDVVVSGNPMTDFACLAQGKHIIMSNSSFSWWATWLNPNNHVDRIICCPDIWFGPNGPQDYEDIYEADWTRISTTEG
jgi:hypothetical protein